jgi:SAM-dependent methyltransferase
VGRTHSLAAKLDYHLRELDIALDPRNPHRSLPAVRAQDRTVLDVGCGVGQTLVAAGFADGAVLVGVDRDPELLGYGAKRFPHLRLLAARGEALPLASDRFDLVLSRVAVPYMNIPAALAEIHRVLRPGGRAWLVLHGVDKEWQVVARALRRREARSLLHQAYVVANGLSLHALGVVFARPGSRTYESFQTASGMARALRRAGFTECAVESRKPFVVTGRK